MREQIELKIAFWVTFFWPTWLPRPRWLLEWEQAFMDRFMDRNAGEVDALREEIRHAGGFEEWIAQPHSRH